VAFIAGASTTKISLKDCKAATGTRRHHGAHAAVQGGGAPPRPAKLLALSDEVIE